MPQFTSWLVLATVLLCHTVVTCRSDDDLPPAEVVLREWEESSQKCHSLDARLTVFFYDVFNDSASSRAQGRFYYEAPDVARYEVTEPSYRMNDRATVSEVAIWRSDEVLTLSLDTRTCTRWPKDRLRSYLTEDRGTGGIERSWLDWFFGHGFFRRIQTPQRCFPLLVDVRVAEVLAEFDVVIERKNGDVLIKATPKASPEMAGYSEVAVLLNPTTYLPRAIQVVNANGRDRVVHVLDDVKVNQQPNNRDELLSVDLSSFRVIEGL